MAAKTTSRFASSDPKDAAWRVEQMHANNAIEGVSRDPILAAYASKLDAEGLSPEEKIARIIAFDPDSVRIAAE